jgi:ELWxxDGT repeat protein
MALMGPFGWHPWFRRRARTALAGVASIAAFAAASLQPSPALAAPSVRMLRDIAGDGHSSAPSRPVAVGELAYFLARDHHGRSLWVTDTTPVGTRRLVGASEGTTPGNSIAGVGGEAFFPASTGDGTELWKTNGTRAGTLRVATFPSSAAAPTKLTALGGRMYFVAADGAHGAELWRSDGTNAGTKLVRDIDPGPDGSAIKGLIRFRGRLYFQANDGTHGAELWRCNGTRRGTKAFDDINLGLPDRRHPREVYGDPLAKLFTPFHGLLYFAGNDGVHGEELWRSNGTEAGTTIVEDISPGHKSSYPVWLSASNGALYFDAFSNRVNGAYRSDGTGDGTELLPGVPVTFGGFDFTSLGRLTLFYSLGGLWRVPDATSPAQEFRKFPESNTPVNHLVPLRGEAYFYVSPGNSHVVFDYNLWRTDGAAAGTKRVLAARHLHVSGEPVAFRGKLLFKAKTVSGTELWALTP